MTTGERIKAARRKAGLTQKELADRLKVTDSTVRGYEAGRTNLKWSTIEKIADALDVVVWELVSQNEKQTLTEFYEDGFCESQAELREAGYDFSSAEMALISEFHKLNMTGKKRAIENITDLAKIEEYTKPQGGISDGLNTEENN